VPINGPLTPLLLQFILLPLMHIFLHLQFTQYYQSIPLLQTHQCLLSSSSSKRSQNYTTHGSQVDKGKQPITSTSMAKSSSSTHSKIKSTSSGKRSLNDLHPRGSPSWKKRSLSMRTSSGKEKIFSKRNSWAILIMLL
jgi:hypothetical protein